MNIIGFLLSFVFKNLDFFVTKLQEVFNICTFNSGNTGKSVSAVAMMMLFCSGLCEFWNIAGKELFG